MAHKVYLDEIDTTGQSKLYSTLSDDSNDSRIVQNSVKGLINSGRELSGPGWDSVRSKLGEFDAALTEREALSLDLSTAINAALSELRAYMDPYAMLDSSLLEEYKSQKRVCEDSIDRLQAMLNEQVTVEYTNPDGTTGTRSENKYQGAERTNIENMLNTARETLTDLQSIISKIEGLDAACDRAARHITALSNRIDAFETMVSGITPSAKVTYTGG